jgi:hypothetical protein
MISYQSIRARYELAVRAALAPEGVVLHYDNVFEQPIPVTGAVAEYAVITVSFPSSTEPDLCGGVVYVRGNVQVTITGPRGAGMRRLEMLAGDVVCALMAIDEFPEPEGVRTGVQGIQGPTSVLVGQDPQAAVVVSAPFVARVESD